MSTPLTKKSTCEEVYNYIEDVIAMRQDEGNLHPVDYDDIWPLKFYTRDEAISWLLDQEVLYKGYDYVSDRENPAEKDEHGHYVSKFSLSIGCMTFVMRLHLPTRIMFEGIRKIKGLPENGLLW